MNDIWIEQDLHSQTILNRNKCSDDTKLYNCWIYKENEKYFITDSQTKLPVNITSFTLRKYKKNFDKHKFSYVSLKKFFYSSMQNYKLKEKTMYIILVIEELELKVETEIENEITKDLDTNKLEQGYHPIFTMPLNPRKNASQINKPQTPQESIPQTIQLANEQETESNLTTVFNNLTQLSQLGNFTLNLIALDDNNQNSKVMDTKRKKTDLNEALTNSQNETLTKSTQSGIITNSCNEKLNSQVIYNEFSNTCIDFNINADLFSANLNESAVPLKSSTQLNFNIDNNHSHHLGNKKNLSPVKESESIPVMKEAKTKSTIKITPLNRNKDKDNQKTIPIKTPTEINLISSDDDDEDDDDDDKAGKINSNEISEDESDNDNKSNEEKLLKVDSPSSSEQNVNKELEAANSVAENSKANIEKLDVTNSAFTATNPYPNKNLLHINTSNNYVRRLSTYSMSSYSTESSNLSLDYSLSSPNSSIYKKKRKLMEKDNRACQKFNDKSNETEDESEDQEIASARNKPDHMLLNNSGYSSIASSSSSSSSSVSSSSSYSNPSFLDVTDVCSKSLIFAPNQVYKYKERLFKKSLSEKKQPSRERIDNKQKPSSIQSIFSPRLSKKQKTQSLQSKAKIVVEDTIFDSSFVATFKSNPSKVCDEIVERQTNLIDETTSPNELKLNGSGPRRRRLFNPHTQNIEQLMNSDCEESNNENEKKTNKYLQNQRNLNIINQTKLSNRTDLSHFSLPNDQSKQINSITLANYSNNTIPMGQKQPSRETSAFTNNSTSLNETYDVGKIPDQKLSMAMANYNFQLNPDDLQGYLIKCKSTNL
jgi:hypothetical protein